MAGSLSVPEKPTGTPTTGRPPANYDLRINDAIAYLVLVRQRFSNGPHIFSRFIETLEACRSRRIYPLQMIFTICQLFYFQPDLIFGFNIVIPNGYHVTVARNGAIFVRLPNGRVLDIPTPMALQNDSQNL